MRDVLSVLRRRYPLATVLIYPVQVQGAEAARDIIATLNLASARKDCEVLLLVRGGGSLEDLAAFNDQVASDSRVTHVLLPVRDGLMLIRHR